MLGFSLANVASLVFRNALRSRLGKIDRRSEKDVLHAATAAGPVAVCELKTFTLEYKGSHAILGFASSATEVSCRIFCTHLRLCYRPERL